MKSRTSFFNQTVFRKNLTRFAPAWGLYTVFLLMGFMSRFYDNNALPGNMVYWIQEIIVTNVGYALLCCMLLFGDLFQTRMCNALHVLPLRRETWFMTNVISGIMFHLIPTAAVGTVSTVLMAMFSYPMGWVAGPLWFLCSNFIYILLFGLAVFSVMCVGNRVAMAVVYGILNFGSMIAWWLVETLYIQQLYGIQTNMESFLWLCPIGYLMEHPVAQVEYIYLNENIYKIVDGILTLEEGWGYLWICAAAGIGLIAVALMLYRRRKLECAGDFLAIRGVEPLFLLVYTLCMGVLFQMLTEFLLIGLIVGYFTGKMFLQRTVRVFRPKEFGKCFVLIALIFGSITVVAWDPLGIDDWIPKVQEVDYVVVTDSHYDYSECKVTLEDEDDLDKVIAVHMESLQWHSDWMDMAGDNGEIVDLEAVSVMELENTEYERIVSYKLEYHLKNGRIVSRYYRISKGSQTYENLKEWFGRPECVFGVDADLDALMKIHSLGYIRLNSSIEPSEIAFSGQDTQTLLEALLADCETGNVVQNWAFHETNEMTLGMAVFSDGLELQIYAGCENVLKWMGEHGVDVEKLLEERGR